MCYMISGEEEGKQNKWDSNLRKQMHGESLVHNATASVSYSLATFATALGAESDLVTMMGSLDHKAEICSEPPTEIPQFDATS